MKYGFRNQGSLKLFCKYAEKFCKSSLSNWKLADFSAPIALRKVSLVVYSENLALMNEARAVYNVCIALYSAKIPSRNGKNCIFTATDAFSKYAVAKSNEQSKADDLVAFMQEEIMCTLGIPKVVITDQGVQFKSNEWLEFADRNGFEMRFTTPYHPQINGVDERVNGTLFRILRAYVSENHEDWDVKLCDTVYVYNTTVHMSTGSRRS